MIRIFNVTTNSFFTNCYFDKLKALDFCQRHSLLHKKELIVAYERNAGGLYKVIWPNESERLYKLDVKECKIELINPDPLTRASLL